MNARLYNLSRAVLFGGWMCSSLVAGVIGTHAALRSDLQPLLIAPVSAFGGLIWSSPIFGIGLFLRSLAIHLLRSKPPSRPPPPETVASGIPIGPQAPAPLAAHAVATE